MVSCSMMASYGALTSAVSSGSLRLSLELQFTIAGKGGKRKRKKEKKM